MFAVYEETSYGNLVTVVYMNPVPEQMKVQGIEIDGELPRAEDISGMKPVLKLKLEEKLLYYDYVRPDSLESRITDLQKENTELKVALAELAELVAGGAK